MPAVLLVRGRGAGGFPGPQPRPGAAVHGGCGEQLPGVPARRADGRRDLHARRPAAYSPYGVLAPLLVMAVPLYDMTSVILIRLREGRSPFQGDRRHFSHRLVARGLTPPQAVWTIDLVTLAGGLGCTAACTGSTGRGRAVVLAQTGLLAGGRGHPGTLGEPFGARQWPDAGRSPRSPDPPRPEAGRESRTPVAAKRRPADRARRARPRRDGRRVWASACAGSPSGLTAALVTARAYRPSEPDLKQGAGAGLIWVLARLRSSPGWRIAAGLIGGRFRFRWSWTDAAVVALMLPGRRQLVACAGSAAGDQPGVGVGRPGDRLPPVAQPAPDPRRIVGAGRRDGRDGVRGLGVWSVSGRRRAAGCSRPSSGAIPQPILAQHGHRPGDAARSAQFATA